MKRILSIFLVLILAFSVVGCKNGENSNRKGYVIVVSQNADAYELNAAEYIKTNLKEKAGLNIEIITDDKENADKNEILIGDTNRELSKEIKKDKSDGFTFSLIANENAFALEAESYVIAAAAYSFCETYVKKDFSLTFPMKEKKLTPTPQRAKNAILLIGDGMGFNHTKLLDNNVGDNNYFYGTLFINKGDCITNSLSGVTDSAAAATALSTGVLTTNGRIGRDKNGKDLELMTEYSDKLGLQSAVMSTEVQTGATPSGFSAHADDRSDTFQIVKSQGTLKNTIISCDLRVQNGKNIVPTINDTLTKLENEKGFFVMYEEAYIDKYSHNGSLASATNAVARFNTAIGAFMEYAFYNPETVVIITADHETGGLMYEKNEYRYTTTAHTGANVPVFAYGYGTEYFNGATVKNIDISAFIRKTLSGK